MGDECTHFFFFPASRRSIGTSVILIAAISLHATMAFDLTLMSTVEHACSQLLQVAFGGILHSHADRIEDTQVTLPTVRRFDDQYREFIAHSRSLRINRRQLMIVERQLHPFPRQSVFTQRRSNMACDFSSSVGEKAHQEEKNMPLPNGTDGS